MLSMRRPSRGCSAALTVLSTLALGLAVACSGKTLPYAGGLMLSVQTDLAAPKDVAAVGLFIASDGRPIFTDTREVAPTGEVKFPATIAILADENRPRAQIKIRAVAFNRNGDVRVLRDIVTTIPKGRTGLLRAPLLWINEGSGNGKGVGIRSGLSTRDLVGKPPDFAQITSACPEGQTFLEGACGDWTVDGDALPDYQEKDVFGGGNAEGEGGRCFDVLACFGPATPVELDVATCSATLAGVDGNDPNLSFAIKLPATADTGECRADGCLVPLDKGSGWKLGGAGVTFPKAICARIGSGAALGVLRTTACPAKDPATPSCGPASKVVASSAPPGLDGGISGGLPDGGSNLGSQDFEVPRFYGGEPNLSGVAVDQDSVYVGRSQAQPPPPGVLRISRADVVAQKVPAQLSMVQSFATPMLSRVIVGPQPKATRVVIGSEDGQVRLCTPSSTSDCPNFPFAAAGASPVMAVGDSEVYVYGSTGGAPQLWAIPFQTPAVEPRTGPAGAPISAMHYSGGRLFMGLVDGSIHQCTVPCQSPAALSQVLSPPPSGGIVSAMTSDDRLPGKLFVVRVPADGVTLSQAGIYVVSMAGQGEQQLAPGNEVLLEGGPPPLHPPTAIGVDSEYVYWGGAFTDSRDGARKYGVVAKKHAAVSSPSFGFLETNGGQNAPVAAISLDAAHVFWAYNRADNALVFSPKKRSF